MAEEIKNNEWGLSNKKSAAIVAYLFVMGGFLKVWLDSKEAASVTVNRTVCFVAVVMTVALIYFLTLEFKKQMKKV